MPTSRPTSRIACQQTVSRAHRNDSIINMHPRRHGRVCRGPMMKTKQCGKGLEIREYSVTSLVT